MKVAIIGTGIAGNVVAHRLHRSHDLTVFEAGDHIGGHSHTHDIVIQGHELAVDTGFIVYNESTYPRFTALLKSLCVSSRPTSMSFSVRDERSGLEYNGTSLNTLFAQRSNLLRPRFFGMIRDILRFNREAPRLLDATQDTAEPWRMPTLAQYLNRHRYGTAFIEQYIAPMGAAIWSTRAEDVLNFPAQFFVRFFHNHGMLSVNERPQWRTICGGSARYVEALTASFRHRIALRTPVRWLRRTPTGVLVKTDGAEASRFDAVFVACHSDQALALLADASPVEREVLEALPYVENEAVLHTDSRLLPRRALAHAAWNYHITSGSRNAVAVTYDMNQLQGLTSPERLLVTLNRTEDIARGRILCRMRYHHPLFTPASLTAQSRQSEINGPRHTYFCGAYWRNGFHEDGVVSAHAALDHFEAQLRNAQRTVHRAG